jgi:transcriptional regulator with XRE-family HTH domain
MLNLRQKRYEAELTQYDMVNRAKIHQSTYSLIERGYRLATQDEKERLARALNCTVHEIDWTAAYENRMAQS